MSAILCAVAELVERNPEASARLRIVLAGTMSSINRQRLEAEVAAHGLAGMMEIRGLISPSQALDLLARSGLALVLAQDQPLQVPAKLYECVGLQVPTLVVAERESASARMAREVGAMTVPQDDVLALGAVLDDLVAGRIVAPSAPPNSISYAKLARDLDELMRAALV
jgi:hypothetical protein